MRLSEAILTGARRYVPLAVPPMLVEPIMRWNTELGVAVTAVVWLPDHSGVLALTRAGQVHHLGGTDGQTRWCEAGGSLCLSACPTASVLATGHLDGMLRLRNAHTGKLVSQLRLGPAWVEHVRWSPDGRWLAAAAGTLLYLLDEVGCPLGCWEHPGTGIEGLSWRADSGVVATACSTGARLVSVPPAGAAAGRQPSPLSLPLGSASSLTTVAWSPTGGHVVARQSTGGLVNWQLPTGAEQEVPTLRTKVPALSWHPRGTQLAAACGQEVVLWAVEARGLQGPCKRLVYHRAVVQQVAFQHQGDLLASADAAGTLALWQPLQQRAPLSVHSFGSGVTSLNWMANDCCLAVGTVQGRVAVLSAAS